MMDRIVSTGLFEMNGKGGLRKVKAEFNDLEPGRVIKWGGNQAWQPTEYVIVKNLGVDERFKAYGAKYITINLENKTYHRTDGHSIKAEDDPEIWHSQHMFLQERVIPADELKDIVSEADELKAAQEAEAAEKERVRLERVEEGRKLAAGRIPKDAAALIVAYHEIDDCDTMTDYFSTHTEEMVILGWSKHQRDLFPEMRKVAARIEETAHLATPPLVDSNGEAKTKDNAKWWHPADEHREKYSMGAGYYLKATSRYRTGWKIRKDSYRSGDNGDWDDRVYESLALRCVLPEPGKTSTQAERATTQVEGVAVTINEEKNGVEVRFPEKPASSVLSELKSNGWRWSRFNACWYNKQTETNVEFANSLME